MKINWAKKGKANQKLMRNRKCGLNIARLKNK